MLHALQVINRHTALLIREQAVHQRWVVHEEEGDGAILMLLDVQDRLVHLVRGIARRGIDVLLFARQLSHLLVARVEVTVGRFQECHVFVEVVNVHVGVEHAVGGNHRHVLVVGVRVHFVGVPQRLVEVHVAHEHTVDKTQICGAMAYIHVPAFVLAVLQHVVFICVSGIHNLVAHAVVARRLQRDLFLGIGGGQLHQILPTHERALVGGVVAGGVAIVAVAAGVHDVPVVHAVGHVAGVVEVGKTHRMAQLMAEHADAVGLTLVHLVAAGIAAVLHVVQRAARALLFWPDGIIRPIAVLALTGIDEERHVYHAVTVVVEVAPAGVDGLGGCQRMLVEVGHIDVFRAGPVLSVIAIAVWNGHRTNHRELGSELTVALVAEIFFDCAVAARTRVVVRLAVAVAEFVVERIHNCHLGVGVAAVLHFLTGSVRRRAKPALEIAVGELNQNHRNLRTALRFQGGGGLAAYAPRG